MSFRNIKAGLGDGGGGHCILQSQGFSTGGLLSVGPSILHAHSVFSVSVV